MELASHWQQSSGAKAKVDTHVLEKIVGVSPAVSALREEISRVAPFSVSVLVTGPTGTGKEVIARTIHKASPRHDKPFIPVDCAAVTGSLFASHMFGHLKGAFTGATYAALGCFRAAESGTIFLDEIGEMEPALQAKLLRVLQQSTVVPVGGHEEVPIDARIIAATNRDLAKEVERGNFREDLYYRLNVVELHSTALSERAEDIPVLVAHFLEEMAFRHGMARKRLDGRAMASLMEYSWPGNVRQLQNLLERLTLLTVADVITGEDVFRCFGAGGRRPHEERADTMVDRSEFELLTSAATSDEPCRDELMDEVLADADAWFSLDDLERKYIELTLKHTLYNQSAAAKLLRIDRSVLRRRIAQLGLEIPQIKRGRPRKPR